MNLKNKIILNSFIPDITCAFVIFAYSITSTQIPASVVKASLKFVIPMILAAQFLIAPLIDYLSYNNISNQVDDFYKTGLNVKQRTMLLEDLIGIPYICSLVTFAFFAAGSFALSFVYAFVLKIPFAVNVLSLFECLYGSFIASLFAYNYCRRVCVKDCYAIVAKGIDKEFVHKKKFLGNSLASQSILFIAIPIICTTIISVFLMISGYVPNGQDGGLIPVNLQIKKIFLTSILNFLSQTCLIILLLIHIEASNKKMTNALEAMEQGDLTSARLLDTDIRDEISYNHFLANEMLLLFRNILSSSSKIGEQIKNSAKELTEVSTTTETTALEQSTGTSEIVSTMENASALSHEIENKITEVAEVAKQTADNITTGLALFSKNMEMLSQIAQANEMTTNGIREVNSKIKSIWDIVNIINSIADQTKIIAFNAELEATGVHEHGMDFRNVSNEIRRLTNGTMESTREIKKYIEKIQNASDNLLTFSNSCTEQVNKGIELARTLEDSLSNINKSSEENADSASEIRQLVTQETAAFDQIVETLHQINISIENFSTSTRTIIDTANLLQETSVELSNINE